MKLRSISFLIACLILATLACGLPGSPQPPTAVPVNTAATAEAIAEQARAVATSISVIGEPSNPIEQPGIEIDVDVEELQHKLASLQPDQYGNITATVTDAEINRAIRDQTELSQDGVTIQDIRIAFSGGNVVLTGLMTTPIQGNVTATFSPELAGGEIQLTLISATLGMLPVPVSLVQSIEQTANDTIGGLMAYLPANYTLQSVTIGEGILTVVARES